MFWTLTLCVVVVSAGCSSSSGKSSSPASTAAGGSQVATVTAGKERDYFIAADEVKWNYAPLGFNAITGKPFDDVADTYVKAGPDRVGSTYTKCLYHGYTDATFTKQPPRRPQDAYLGLLGPVIRAEVGVDREVFGLFSVMNENNTHYIDQEIKALPQPPADPGSDEFTESNLMHSINGHVFGNGPMVTVKKGERVRWYVMSMGTEVDLHTPHWHGTTVTVMGMRMDTVQLLPAGMVVADMVPDDVGIWLFHCHVNDHVTAGMLTRYQVVN